MLSMMADGVEENRQAIIASGGLRPVLELLLRGDLWSRGVAATIIWRLALSEPVRQAILTVFASLGIAVIVRVVRERQRVQAIRKQKQRQEVEQSLLSSEAADQKRKRRR